MPTSMNRPEVRIGVVVPNFNDSHHIARCLDSILEQEVRPDELVVVDDCSTDDSVEVIRSLIQGREGVKFIMSPENRGVYGALELGASHTSSEYLMFVAANDFVFPGVFAHAKRRLTQRPGVGLWSAMGWLVDNDDRPIRALALAVPALHDRYFSPAECIDFANRLGNWFAGPTVVYHRETYESVGRFNPALQGLADLVCALMVAGKRGAVFTPIPYAVFRLHEGSYLASTLGKPEVLLPLLRELTQFGCKTAPELFTENFTDRTVRRLVFSSIRASAGRLMTAYTPTLRKPLAHRLALVNRLLPNKCKLLRTVAAFLVLRPFDIWPTIVNRYCGTAVIAMRHKRKVKFFLDGIGLYKRE